MALNAWSLKLGSAQGRIQPVGYTPTQGSYAFVLGSDVAGSRQRLNAGDYVETAQTANLGGSTLLRFNARTRGIGQLPKAVWIIAAAAGTWVVAINGTSFTYTAAAGDGTLTIANALASEVNAGTEPVTATLTGAFGQLQITADDPAIPFALSASGPGSVVLGTFMWRLEMLIDGVPYFSQTVRPMRTRDRIDGGAMVRNIAAAGGTHEIAFRLALVGTVPLSTVEIELPGVYIDNMTLDIYDDDPITGFVEGIAAWWRSDQALDSSGVLTTWPARIGSSTIIVDAVEAPAPTVGQGGSNAQPFVDFDGTQAAHTPDADPLDIAAPGPAITVLIGSDAVGTGTWVSKGALGVAVNYGQLRAAPGAVTALDDTGLPPVSTKLWDVAGRFASVSIVEQAAGSTVFRFDGDEETVAGSVLAVGSEPLHLGAGYAGPFGAGAYMFFLTGRLYDVFVANKALTLFEQLRIEGYREARYLRA